MTRLHALFILASVVLGALLPTGACGIPECIDGPSNLTPESTMTCDAPDIAAAPQIASAGSEWLDDGTLVITWTSQGLECGTRAADVDLDQDCNWTGWIFTVEIPAELAVAGTLDMKSHPEIIGTMTVSHDGSGGSTGSIGDEPFFTGQLELTQLDGGCVTGIFTGFGTGDPDPTLGGPELNGSFIAPTC